MGGIIFNLQRFSVLDLKSVDLVIIFQKGEIAGQWSVFLKYSIENKNKLYISKRQNYMSCVKLISSFSVNGLTFFPLDLHEDNLEYSLNFFLLSI